MGRASLRRVALAAAALGVSACGAGDPGAESVARLAVDTVAGTERWLYPGRGGPALGWSIDTLAVIGGALVEDAAYQFDRVDRDGLASDGARRLYVLDRAGSRVLVYDSLGGHLATHGRQGGGPGELGQPVSLAVGPGDSVWVADLGNRRYTVYPPDGGEPRSVPFPEAAGLPYGPFAVRDDGLLQVLRPFGLRRLSDDAGDPPPEPPRPILRLTPTGAIADTLWVSEPPQVDEARSSDDSADMRIAIRMTRALEPTLQWQPFSDGGIVVADSAGYAFHLVDADGAVRRRIDRDLPPRPTTEADRELARERVREGMSRGGGIRIAIGGAVGGAGASPPSLEQLLQAQLDAMTFAPVIPRITGIRVDRQDRIWVGVSLDEAGTTERVDLYDRDGRLLGELAGWELPDLFLGPSLAARIVRDELEAQQIVVYRIREGAAR